MSSVIQVANRALTKLGSARITSIDDDVKAAREVKSCFDDLRDDELRAYRWSFAMKRESLPALSAAPAFGYQLQYQLPADFLRIDMVDDRFPYADLDNYVGRENLDWVVEQGKILTDIAAPLKVRYVARIEDPNAWDANFREALACRIAAELAEPMTQSVAKRELAWKEYRQAINRAVRSNSIEKLPVTLPDNAWMVSRL
ncbi:MAG: hypothetical protein RI988_736 [Pseudomonadota bacterium]|jgi:hypothetical protein